MEFNRWKYSNSSHMNSETAAGTAFNPLLLVKKYCACRFPTGKSEYYYRNYDIGFSIEVYNGYPHRVLSITPYGFDRKPLTGSELCGLLSHFGFYSFLPVENYKTGCLFDPIAGDTQYYRQMVMDLKDLQNLPAAAGQ